MNGCSSCWRGALAGAIGALALLGSVLAPAALAAGVTGRYIVTVRGAADYQSARASLIAAGAEVIEDLPELNLIVVATGAIVTAPMAAAPGVTGMALDHISRVSPPEGSRPNLEAPGLLSARQVPMAGPTAAPDGIRPDPAFGYRGLLWDYRRIGLPEAWATSAGSGAVTVGVSDTGLDFTHVDLKPSIVHVEDFTLRDPLSACKDFLGSSAPSNRRLAKKFGGPVSTDWNGHGSWIGGNIAAALNGTGTNGIAPKVKLVALKIAENCGYAYDSTILASFVWAAWHGVDIVSISFGGYLDRSVHDENVIYKAYADAVAFARGRGTLIVAAAGNEHARIGAAGKVLSHGTVTLPGDPLFDEFGLYEVPGGLPGVIDVSSTGKKVIPSSASCSPGTTGDAADIGNTATCKPRSDRHQAAGAGLKDQLSYFSNYGPRIDVAAPGGARKFNLPYWDRGGSRASPTSPRTARTPGRSSARRRTGARTCHVSPSPRGRGSSPTSAIRRSRAPRWRRRTCRRSWR